MTILHHHPNRLGLPLRLSLKTNMLAVAHVMALGVLVTAASSEYVRFDRLPSSRRLEY